MIFFKQFIPIEFATVSLNISNIFGNLCFFFQPDFGNPPAPWSSGEGKFFALLFLVILYGIGYGFLFVIEKITKIIIQKFLMRFNSPVNVASIIVLPIIGFVISLFAAFFIPYFLLFLLAIVDMVWIGGTIFFLIFNLLLYFLILMVVAYLTGEIIAVTTKKYKAIQGLFASGLFIAIGFLYDILTGPDESSKIWLVVSGYVGYALVLLFTYLGSQSLKPRLAIKLLDLDENIFAQ